jgi:hypothetical protein
MTEHPGDDVYLDDCPFCGGKADISEGRSGDEPWFYVECDQCSATGDSVEVWNRRAPVTEGKAIALLRRIREGHMIQPSMLARNWEAYGLLREVDELLGTGTDMNNER